MAQRSPAAQAAFDQAQAAGAAGDWATAHRLYEYAQRLAPSDATITLSVGTARLQRRDPSAAEPFELIAARFDVREIWLGLAAARHLAGKMAQAAGDLGRALSRHAPSAVAATLEFQDEVARLAGAPGWCGLSADGVLQVAPGLRARATEVVVSLDGRRLALPAGRGGGPLRLSLPGNWRAAAAVTVTAAGTPLIGSPIAIAAIIRVEGFVAARDRGLEGWAWLPGDPDRAATLLVQGPAGIPALRITATRERLDIAHPTVLARPRAFTVHPAELVGLDGALEVRGEDGRQLYGSPLDPSAEACSAAVAAALVRARFPARAGGRAPDASRLILPALPADITGPPPTAKPVRRGVDVIIPVYRGLAETLACLDSVLAGAEKWMRVLVVDDASPDAALVAALERLATAGRITLLQQKRNGGFPVAANAGLVAAGADRDVVLLNSDTLVPKGWLARLREAALGAADIGTVTPLSNDATILSYPLVDGVNPVPDLAETRRLDAVAREVNGREVVDIPTAIGFCMYIRRECLDAVGLLRPDIFAQGYGEENDFCIRARHLGWRHVGLAGLYVGHVGGLSFGAAKAHLIARNLTVLNRLHPGYDALVAEYQARDPLLAARRRMDAARWQAGASQGGAVLLLTHDRIGGVLRRVGERCAALRAQGFRPIVLTPRRWPDGRAGCSIGDDTGESYPNLRFAIPDELDALVALLAQDRPRAMEVHHFVGHDPAMLRLAGRLGIPHDVAVHDYAWFCPRITLVGAGDRYCGEPDLAGCEACIADHGGKLEQPITPTALVARSRQVLGQARRVITPAADVARRMRAHFPGLQPVVEAWEDDAALPERPGRRAAVTAADRVQACVVGAVGTEKGYDVLLACARDAAARGLDLEFSLVGYSLDDARLLATGRVSISGPYDAADAVSLIRAQRADLALLPSIWPETWSYVLTQIWAAGLPVMAFDIGAPGERIRRTGRGWLLPLGLGPAVINNRLLAQGTQRRQAARAA